MVPPVIDPIVQRTGADCALAALAMAAGLPYRTVSDVALDLTEKPHMKGLWVADMRRLMRQLGNTLRNVKPDKLREHGGGVMVVEFPKGERHCVTVYHDLIIDPVNGLIWEPDAYYQDSGANATRGLIIGEPIRGRKSNLPKRCQSERIQTSVPSHPRIGPATTRATVRSRNRKAR